MEKVSFVDVINSHIENGQVVLPVFSPTALRVQQELVKKEPDVRLLEEIISADQSLSSQVLQIANSAFYKGLAEVLTVRAAIVRLGIREVGRVSLFVAARNQFRSKEKALTLTLHKLWQHAFGTAMAAKWLAVRCQLEELESHAFFAGLLHDIGKLFVLMVVDQLPRQGEATPINTALLGEAMDTLHCEQGYNLMEKWNIPEKYCLIARDHHKPVFDAKNHLLILVRLANLTCHKLGIGLQHDSSLVVSSTEEAEYLNLSEIDLAELEIYLEDTAELAA